MTRFVLALSLLASAWTPPSVAQAQEAPPGDESPSSVDEARAAFEAGRAAYEEGRFEAALEGFQRAYELTGSADILYNIGTVADRLRRDQLALESYQGYLTARPDSPDRAQVEARVEVLESQIQAEAEAAAARDAAREADARALREAEEEAARNRRLAEQRRAEAPAPFEPSPVPWVLVATGGAALVAGVVLVALSAVDSGCVSDPTGCVEEDTAPRWEEVEGAYERVPVFQGVGGALIGVGAVATGVGLAWGLSQGGGEEAVVSVGPGSVRVRGRF